MTNLIKDIEIIFEDEFLIAANKPSGITTIPGNFQNRDDSLVGILEKQLNQKLFVVHRLDRDTSGIVVFAKDSETHKNLCIQFEKGLVEKFYIALVKGVCNFREKTIDIPISKSKINSKKVALSQKGLKAITKIKVLKTFDNYSLLEVYPITGKRHQIRLHLKAIGHPLAIDKLYGNKKPIYLSNILKEKSNIKIANMPLYAYKISFMHPKNNERITLSINLPHEIQILLEN